MVNCSMEKDLLGGDCEEDLQGIDFQGEKKETWRSCITEPSSQGILNTVQNGSVYSEGRAPPQPCQKDELSPAALLLLEN